MFKVFIKKNFMWNEGKEKNYEMLLNSEDKRFLL